MQGQPCLVDFSGQSKAQAPIPPSFVPSFLLAGDETGIVGLSAEGGGGRGGGKPHVISMIGQCSRARPSVRSSIAEFDHLPVIDRRAQGRSVGWGGSREGREGQPLGKFSQSTLAIQKFLWFAATLRGNCEQIYNFSSFVDLAVKRK